jgi:protein-arginine kinase activator protein McsA
MTSHQVGAYDGCNACRHCPQTAVLILCIRSNETMEAALCEKCGCPHGFNEREAANAELKALGVVP